MTAVQISFSKAGAAEISRLPKSLQLQILNEFHVLTPNFLEKNPDRFGRMVRGNASVFRYRALDYRIYFQPTPTGFLILRVLHKNTLQDFLFRSHLPASEDQVLQENPSFWAMIDPSRADEHRRDE